jgi:hypothetical protein
MCICAAKSNLEFSEDMDGNLCVFVCVSFCVCVCVCVCVWKNLCIDIHNTYIRHAGNGIIDSAHNRSIICRPHIHTHTHTHAYATQATG